MAFRRKFGMVTMACCSSSILRQAAWSEQEPDEDRHHGGKRKPSTSAVPMEGIRWVLERCSREICMAMWRLTTCFVIWLRSGGLSWYVCYRYDDHL